MHAVPVLIASVAVTVAGFTLPGVAGFALTIAGAALFAASVPALRRSA